MPATWTPSGASRLLGILGHPVAHSLSPRLHHAVYAAEGRDAVYVPFPVAPERFPEAVRGLVAVGLVGANVTVPHKLAAHDLVDDRTAEATLVGAVNTLHVVGDRLVGDNTDVGGLARALRTDVGDLTGAACVVVGAGGAARAAVVALVRAGAAVTVLARRAAPLADLTRVAAAAGGTCAGVLLDDTARARAAVSQARLVCNATPLGLHDEDLPDVASGLGDGQVAYDLLYRDTPWQRAARAAGAAAHDGGRMLVEQAAASHARWFGVEPGPAAAAMRRALTAAT